LWNYSPEPIDVVLAISTHIALTASPELFYELKFTMEARTFDEEMSFPFHSFLHHGFLISKIRLICQKSLVLDSS